MSLPNDFVSLSNEAKKRFPEIKEASERALLILRSAAKDGEYDETQSSEIVSPLILSIDSRNSKLILLAVNTLHRLLSQRIPSLDDACKIVLRMDILVQQSQEVQLKTLQILLNISTSYPIRNQEICSNLRTCHILMDSKVPAVSNTASATFRQILTSTFERAVSNLDIDPLDDKDKAIIQEKGKEFIVHFTVHDSYLLFLDLCLKANGETPYFLKIDLSNKIFFLEVIDSILYSNAILFQKNPPFLSLLRDKVCPMLLKRHNEKLEYMSTLRIFKIMQRIIEKFSESLEMEAEIFLNLFLKTVNGPANKWVGVIALEILHDISADLNLTRTLFKKFDMREHSVKVLSDMMKSFCKVEVCEDVVEFENRPSCISSLERTELPALPNSYKNFISIDAILNIISSWSLLVLKEVDGSFDWLNGNPWMILPLSPKKGNLSDVEEMFSKNWDLYVNGVDLILHSYKLAFQLWKRFFQVVRLSILAVSVLGRRDLVESGWNIILNSCLPQSLQIKANSDLSIISNLIGDREVLAFENFCILSVNLAASNQVNWTTFFDCFNFYEFLLKSFPKNGIAFEFEESVVRSCMELCLGSLPKYILEGGEDVLRSFCKGFGQACFQLITCETKNIFFRQNLKDDEIFMIQKALTFAKTFKVPLREQKNAAEWKNFWQPFIDVCNVDDIDSIVRKTTSNGLFSLIWDYLNGIDGKDFEANEYLQVAVLTPLTAFSKIPDEECHKLFLDFLNKVLHSHGQFFRYVWPDILDMIKFADTGEEKKEKIRSSFPSLQLICADYLSFLPSGCIEKCLEVLQSFTIQTEDMNISLTSVGLMWNVAYHLREERSKSLITEETYNALYKGLLGRLSSLSLDSRAEVRNSVIQTTVRTVSFNGSVLTVEQWMLSFDILFPIISNLVSASTKEKSPAGLASHDLKQWFKQWDESKIILIGGLGKIFLDGAKKLISLKIFQGSWFRFLDLCSQIVLTESNEVCVAIFKAIKSLISSKQLVSAAGSLDSKSCWEGTFLKWKSMTNQMLTQKSPGVNQEAFLSLSSCFGDIYSLCGGTSSNGSIIGQEEIRFCFDQFRAMINYQFVGEIIGDTENPTSLQQLMLDNLSLVKLGSPQEECFKIDILCQVSDLPFRKRIMAEESGGQGAKKSISQSSFLAVTRKSLGQICSYLKDKEICKASISCGIFRKVIDTLAVPMSLKYKCPLTAKGPSLWKIAVEYYRDIVEVSLDVLESMNESARDTWTSIIKAAKGFIEADGISGNTISVEDLELDEALDLKFLEFLEKKILIRASFVDEATLKSLFEAIEEGSNLYEEQASLDPVKNQVVPLSAGNSAMPSINTREKFAATCLNLLFSICQGGKEIGNQQQQRVAQICIPVLLKRCDSVLKRYAEEKPMHGRFPLSRVRNVEISYILTQLASLELPIGLIGHLLSDRLRGNACNSSKAHLFYLYQSLCSCLRTDDAAIMNLIQKCLLQIGSEMGMDSDDAI